MKPTIKIITNVSGDWLILTAGDFKCSNYYIGMQEFTDLLRYLGYDIIYQFISDEEMERLS